MNDLSDVWYPPCVTCTTSGLLEQTAFTASGFLHGWPAIRVTCPRSCCHRSSFPCKRPHQGAIVPTSDLLSTFLYKRSLWRPIFSTRTLHYKRLDKPLSSRAAIGTSNLLYKPLLLGCFLLPTTNLMDDILHSNCLYKRLSSRVASFMRYFLHRWPFQRTMAAMSERLPTRVTYTPIFCYSLSKTLLQRGAPKLTLFLLRMQPWSPPFSPHSRCCLPVPLGTSRSL